jgi:AcrR family transcriptional regulator
MTILFNPAAVKSTSNAITSASLEPRWERRKDARPLELVDAALELFVERGFSSTRLDDVAKRAGVSKGTLYLYFDSKDDLFKAVVREGIVSRIAVFEKYLNDSDKTATVLLEELIRAWWEQIASTKLGGISKLMMSEAGNFPELAKFYHAEVMTRGCGLFKTVMERGMASGEFRKVETEYAERVCSAPMVMLMLWRNSFDLCCGINLDPEGYLQTYTQMMVRALKAD